MSTDPLAPAPAILALALRAKQMAKELDVIVVAASQIGRKQDGEGPEIGLHDAKNAGEIENSAGVVIGAWRDNNDGAVMHLQVLKNTKGIAGTRVRCNFNGATMQITEQSVIEDRDVPRAVADEDVPERQWFPDA